MDRLDRIKGSLLGGAVGDALGYCVEFDSEQHIFSRFGRCGIRNYVLTGSKALFSDDTQMSLYTACGLLCVEARGKAASTQDYTDSIWYAYLDWLKTQNGKMTREVAYLKSRDITLLTKARLVKVMVFPVAIYGCES